MVAKENVTIGNIVVGGTMREGAVYAHHYMKYTWWFRANSSSMMSLGDDLHALHRETLFNDEFR